MSKTKLWQKPLAGVVAAAMVMTGIPVTASAEVQAVKPQEKLIASFDFNDTNVSLTDGAVLSSDAGAKATVVNTDKDFQLVEHDGGNALQFDGKNSLNVTKEDGTPVLAGKEEITISYQTTGNMWSFFLAPSTNAQPYLKENYVGMLNDVTVERYCNGRDEPTSSKTNSGVNVADWTDITVVLTETATKFYVGRELKVETSSQSTLSQILGESGGVFQLGKANWNAGEYSKGQLDNFKVYDGALTTAQIAGNEEITQELLVDFSFDDYETGFVGGGAKATVEKPTIRLNYETRTEGDSALNFGDSNSYLDLTKADGSSLLTGLNNVRISYDSKCAADGNGWTIFAADDDTYPGDDEHYLGVMDKIDGFTLERFYQGRPAGSSINATGSSEWKHVDIDVTNDATVVYVNGTEVARQIENVAPLSQILGDNSIFWVGKAAWGNEFFKGQMDNLKIYDTTPAAMTDIQVTAPAKTEYNVGDSLDAAGMKVEAVYDNGTVEEVAAEDYTMDFDSSSEGTKTVTVSVTVGETVYTDTFDVIVKAVQVDNITVDGAPAEAMTVGDTVTLSAKVTPENAANKEVTWASENTGVAAVDENGVVTAVGAGETNITATAKDGSGIVGTAAIKVKEKTYTVTAKNGTVKDGKSEYTYQEKATVTTDMTTEDGNFVGWQDAKGNYVCYAATYTFPVIGDTDLTAVHTTEEVKKEVSLTCKVSFTGEKMLFTASRVVPAANCDGTKVKAHGIILTSKEEVGKDENSFVLGTAGVTNSAAKTTFGLVGTYDVKVKGTSGKTYYARSYVTYVDSETKEEVTKYSETVPYTRP